MALAGLWENWRSPAGEWVRSFAIVTTRPNELCAELHDRMPVILDPGDWDAWLGEATPRTTLRSLMRPAPAEAVDLYAVSPAVNNVRNEGPELLAPLSRWSDGL